MRLILGIFFVLGMVYIMVPGPARVEDFPPLPSSVKSNLDGDTWQNPNIAAYFSGFVRKDITEFYRQQLAEKYFFGKIIPPISLNYPPEAAYTYIRDQQESTFLEEYTYPLREPFFVNGYEPAVENKMFKKPSNFVGNHIWYDDLPYNSKTTLRFYPTNFIFRTVVYFGIWAAGLALLKLYRKVLSG